MSDSWGWTSENNYDIITINKLKEEINMSIVGIIKCNDGALVFSDSKSTLNFKPEKGRENINKIFFNKNIVVCCYKYNTINEIPIEKIIPKMLQENKILNADAFRQSLLKYLIENNANVCGDFIIYEIKTNTIWRLTANVEVKLLNPCEKIDDKSVSFFGGNEYYINCLIEFVDSLGFEEKNVALNMEEVQKLLEEDLTKIIRTLDTIRFNNPCGLPLKFYIFKY